MKETLPIKPIYRATIRIPTAEPYAYLEITVEDTSEGILEAYRGFTELVRVKGGIPDKDFDRFIDSYLLGEKNHVEEYQKMSDDQKKTVQIIKRSLARLKARGHYEDNQE